MSDFVTYICEHHGAIIVCQQDPMNISPQIVIVTPHLAAFDVCDT